MKRISIQKLHWWRYYYITRKRERIIPWIAHHLPRQLKYYVVIDGMAYYTVEVNPHAHPDDVKAWDILFVFDDSCKRFHPHEKCVPGQNHPAVNNA